MEIKGNIKSINHLGNQIEITLVTTDVCEFQSGYDKLKGKVLNVVIKLFRKKRSKDSNAYAWAIISEIAATIGANKWDIYIDMISKYGVFIILNVVEGAVEQMKRQWREVIELGPVKVNGQEGVQLQCYFGSSTYDTKQMSAFIDGIINEANDMGIETLPVYELEQMKREWGV